MSALDTVVVAMAAIGEVARLDAETVTDERRKSLARAVELGADNATLQILIAANRLKQRDTIVLPPGQYEHLSRGRGWARQGRGSNVTWGERDEHGYRVGPGRWDVGSTDGFSRKRTVTWIVKHVQVGSETWTVAS